ncbi:V4R domain-containing protein [Gemmatimonadota bacterium]
MDGETKCAFDEGLISGILTDYFKLEFETKEVGCWATGEKRCIFRSAPMS